MSICARYDLLYANHLVYLNTKVHVGVGPEEGLGRRQKPGAEWSCTAIAPGESRAAAVGLRLIKRVPVTPPRHM